MVFFKVIIIFVLTLFLLSCSNDIIQSNETENDDHPGEIQMKMDLTKMPTDVIKIIGFLARAEFDTILFHFEIHNDTATVKIDNIITGVWYLEVNAYIAEDIISYSGSQMVNIVPAVVTPIRLYLNPVRGGLDILVTWGPEHIYFEGFEATMDFGSYKLVNGNSYLKEGRDGWKAYAEAFYDGREVSPDWNWISQDNPQDSSKSIRGITTVDEMGYLWLFKSFPVDKNEKLIVSIQTRTKKVHNGSDTGPRLYVFNGDLNLPSVNSLDILGNDQFIWSSWFWSDWEELSVYCEPTEGRITVGILVGDGWNSYTIYHEFDSLKLYNP